MSLRTDEMASRAVVWRTCSMKKHVVKFKFFFYNLILVWQQLAIGRSLKFASCRVCVWGEHLCPRTATVIYSWIEHPTSRLRGRLQHCKTTFFEEIGMRKVIFLRNLQKWENIHENWSTAGKNWTQIRKYWKNVSTNCKNIVWRLVKRSKIFGKV